MKPGMNISPAEIGILRGFCMIATSSATGEWFAAFRLGAASSRNSAGIFSCAAVRMIPPVTRCKAAPVMPCAICAACDWAGSVTIRIRACGKFASRAAASSFAEKSAGISSPTARSPFFTCASSVGISGAVSTCNPTTPNALAGYTRNWLLICAGLFLFSAAVYAVRVIRSRPRTPAAVDEQPGD